MKVKLKLHQHCSKEFMSQILDGEVTGEYREVSPWWQRLRDRLIKSTHISSALLAALVARSVAMEIGKAVMVSVLISNCFFN